MHTLTPNLLLIYSFLGLAAAYFAKRTGRNPYIWFSIGTFFGILALITIYILNHRKNMVPVQTKPCNSQKPKEAPDLSLKAKDSRFWYYLDKKHIQQGPISFTKLYSLWEEKEVSLSTYLWNEDLDDWKHLKEVDAFQEKSVQ